MIERGLSEDYATTTPRTFRGRANGRLQLAGVIVEGDRVLVGVSELRDEKRYRVTATDLELSTYGGLLPDDAADLEVHTDAILPEVLEAYLSSR